MLITASVQALPNPTATAAADAVDDPKGKKTVISCSVLTPSPKFAVLTLRRVGGDPSTYGRRKSMPDRVHDVLGRLLS
jgi:hypothetical protein